MTALLLAAALGAAPSPAAELDRAAVALEELACFRRVRSRLEAAVVDRVEARTKPEARAAGARWRAAYRALSGCGRR